MTTYHVYVIRTDKFPIYVGMSADVHTRFINHKSQGCVSRWAKDNPGTDAHMIVAASFQTRDEALSHETQLILELKPVLNRKITKAGGRPRIGEEYLSIGATKPWLTEGVSRSTWYRQQRGA